MTTQVDNMETHHPEGAKATDAPVRLDRGGGWRIATRDGAESSDLESIVDRSIVGVGWAEWHGGRPILSGGGATTAADRDAAKTGLVLTLDDDRTLYATTEAGPTGQPAYVVLSGTVRQNGHNGTPPDAWLARSTAVGERRAAARATLAKA